MLEIFDLLELVDISVDDDSLVLVEECGKKSLDLMQYKIVMSKAKKSELFEWIRGNMMIDVNHCQGVWEKNPSAVFKMISSQKNINFTDEMVNMSGGIQNLLKQNEPEVEETVYPVDTPVIPSSMTSQGFDASSAVIAEVKALRDQLSQPKKFTVDSLSELPFGQLNEIAIAIIQAAELLEQGDYHPAKAFKVSEIDALVNMLKDFSPTLFKEYFIECVQTAELEEDRIRVSRFLDGFVTFADNVTGGMVSRRVGTDE